MPCPLNTADGVPIMTPFPEDIQEDRQRLHEAGPVTKVELPGEVRVWATTHHDVSKSVLGDPRFARNPKHWEALRTGEVPETWPLIGVLSRDEINMLGLDGAPHRRMRQLTAYPFSARRVERLRPHIERITAHYLDTLEDRAHEPLDLKPEFTFKVPITVVGELYGIDEKDYVFLGDLYARLFFVDTDEGEHLRIYSQLYEFFTELVARKKADPDQYDDFATDLLKATEEGKDPLTEEEVVITMLMVLAAGHETTVNLLNNAILALLDHPGEHKKLLEGEYTWEQVIEETLRYNPPNNSIMFRYATEDVELEGAKISKGEAVLTHYGAITKDANKHKDPHVFDPGREERRHISFGHGPHMCPGAALARLEARIVLPMLFERFPDLELAVPREELRNEPALIVNSLKEFPILLRP